MSTEETKTSKAFVKFIEALDEDINEVSGEEGSLDREKVAVLSKRIKSETISLLEKSFAENKRGIKSSVVDFAMDVFFNFVIFDNCQFFKAKQYELLTHRYDMSWFYFRNLIDSFGVLRGLVDDLEEAEKNQNSNHKE